MKEILKNGISPIEKSFGNWEMSCRNSKNKQRHLLYPYIQSYKIEEKILTSLVEDW